MKEAGKILAYLAAVLCLGALLAPPLWWVGQALAPHVLGLAFLRETDFQRFFNRAMLIAAIALLWPAIRWLRIGSRKELGLEPNPRAWRDLGTGFLAAAVPLLLLGAVLVHLNIYRLKPELPWDALPKILLTALVVSAIEESLFRGGLQGLVARSSGPRFALPFVAALFSIVHFLKPREEVVETVRWWSGFELVPHAFWQFSEPGLVLAGFTTLFVVGWILGEATLRTRSLWMAFGLHAGWICGLKGFSKMTRRVDRDTLPWLGENLLQGLAPLMVLALTYGIVRLLLLRAHARVPGGR